MNVSPGGASRADRWTSDSFTPKRRAKILVLLGTRPEAIKLVPVIHRLAESPLLRPVVVASGQHRDLVGPVLALAGIEPDVDFALGRPGLTLNALTAGILTHLEAYLDTFGPHAGRSVTWENIVEGVRRNAAALSRPGSSDPYTSPQVLDAIFESTGNGPSAIIVHGDTTTAMAGALAGFHHSLPVIHVEAGLRSGSLLAPWPEEANRRLIGRLAALHFPPTVTAAGNLIREFVDPGQMLITGNTGIDALQWAAGLSVPWGAPVLDDLDDDPRRVVVVTTHRRENWDGGITRVNTAVAQLAKARPEVRFVVPMHPNPAVRAQIRPILEGLPNVNLVEPMGYAAFARLLARATLALSDSGGIQEEGPALGTPVLVCRDTTERVEGLSAGTIRLVGTNIDVIVAAVSELLDDPIAYADMRDAPNPYGDGRAAQRVVDAIEHVVFRTRPPESFRVLLNRRSVLDAAGYPAGLIEATLEARARQLRAEQRVDDDDDDWASRDEPGAPTPPAPGPPPSAAAPPDASPADTATPDAAGPGDGPTGGARP